MDTLLPTGPTLLLFRPGTVVARGWGSYGQPYLRLPPLPSTDTPRTPRMEYGKDRVGRLKASETVF